MWYTAILIGLTGGFHCAGMCSPLLMTVTNLTGSAAVNRLVYNGGRIITYGILGSMVSSVGFLLPIGKYQILLSLVFGILIIVIAVTRLDKFKIPGLFQATQMMTSWLKKKFAFLLMKKNIPSVFLMGMLNGFLPCGMSMVALSYCLLLKGPLDGFNFMLLFGVGTLPVMLGLAPLILAAIRKINVSMQQATTGLMIFAGVVLIARTFIHAGIEAHVGNTAFIDVVLCR